MSRSLIGGDGLENEIATIIERSCSRNEALGLTGALIASPDHFAQYMEGPADAVAALMGRISRDGRHADARVVDQGDRADRLFPQWSMAYVGTSVFVERTLSRLFDGLGDDRAAQVARVLSLIREFARPYQAM